MDGWKGRMDGWMGGWIKRGRDREGGRQRCWFLPPPSFPKKKQEKEKEKTKKEKKKQKEKGEEKRKKKSKPVIARNGYKNKGTHLRFCTNTYMIFF